MLVCLKCNGILKSLMTAQLLSRPNHFGLSTVFLA
jgi:hypothetical protein